MGIKPTYQFQEPTHLKDWRHKVYSGHLVDHGERDEMGWQIFVPELNDTIAGVNCIFNKIIPHYTEEYFNTVRALQHPDRSGNEQSGHRELYTLRWGKIL